MNKKEQAGNGEIEPLSQRVARRLRGRMAELQLRGTDVAAKIGMTQGSFSRRYTGSAAWELDELELLERNVGITIDYLLGRDQAPAGEAPQTGAILMQPQTGAIIMQPRPAPEPGPPAGPAPGPVEIPPAPQQPQIPELRYPDPSPIRFDSGAWPGLDPRPRISQPASA